MRTVLWTRIAQTAGISDVFICLICFPPQSKNWTESCAFKATQAFVVGGAVGAATGLFVFGTQIHSNTVNYDAPWRDQFRQMGKVQY